MRATVKWWSQSKGYGFLDRGDNRDIFVHYSSIIGDGPKELEEGLVVECDVIEGPKGPQAANVKRLT